MTEPRSLRPPLPPEVLAPGGSLEAIAAAIGHGANAIYLGLGNLNARVRAGNLDAAGLRSVVRTAHAERVAVHVTLNVPLAEATRLEALETLVEAWSAGVDAVILRDPALMRWCRSELPELPVHASTQAGVAGPDAAKRFADLGCGRVILARECSLDDIRAIHAACPEVELESFVFGAQCFGFSGACLLGEALGGRSGNYGNCLQACRLPFFRPDGARLQHLLSMKDLDYVRRIPELVEAGVVSLKIEGRLKSPEWVGCVTHWVAQAAQAASAGPLSPTEYLTFDREVRTLFSRARTDAFLDGRTDAAELIHSDSPGHLGLAVSFQPVPGHTPGRVRFRTPVPLSIRDGLLWHRPGSESATRHLPAAIRRLYDSRGRSVTTVSPGTEVQVEVPPGGPFDRLAIHSCQAVRNRYAPDRKRVGDLTQPGLPTPRFKAVTMTEHKLEVTGCLGPITAVSTHSLKTESARGSGTALKTLRRLFPDAHIDSVEGIYVNPSDLKQARRDAVAALTWAWDTARAQRLGSLRTRAQKDPPVYQADDAALLARGPAAVSRVTGLPSGPIVTSGGDLFELEATPRGTVVRYRRGE